MVAPDYYCFDFLRGKFQLTGDSDKINEIRILAEENLNQKIDLYTAMDSIKHTLSEKYGSDWLYKSEEAVEFIVEKAYCNVERYANPIFNQAQYENDMRTGCLY